jgi:hypothetical protein
MLKRDTIDITSLRVIPGGTEKNRDAANPLRATPHAIDLRIDRKVFALHTNELRFAVHW